MNGRKRGPIMRALEARLRDRCPEFRSISRRVREITNVDDGDMPALFIVKPHENVKQGSEASPESTTLEIELWIYISDGKDPNTVPAVILDDLLDSLDTAFTPDLPLPFNQNCTLGGTVSHCWIEGQITTAPGDLDGYGLAMVPVRILVP